MTEVNRLTNLKVKEVSLVDNPAIREVFYVVKQMKEEQVDKEDKVIVKTIEEVEKEFNEYEANLIAKVGEAKGALESILEKGLTDELKEAVGKVMDFLSEIEKMKHPGMMIGTPHNDEKEDEEKKKQLEDQQKDLEEQKKSMEEVTKTTLEQTQKSMGEVKDAIHGLSEGMKVLCDTMTNSFGDEFVSKVEKAMTGIGSKLEELGRELEKKAGKDEVPLRKGVTSNKETRPTEEDVKEKSPITKIKESDKFKSASPRERLDMVLPTYLGE